MSEKTLKVHPAASAFPKITDQDLKELTEDIKKNGIRVPILVRRDREGAREADLHYGRQGTGG
jgi:ParB-like chromosome segregation protein Spo0J